eukprot:GGOE01003900.1.p1 GENE.GGOE01003900.1~~GGOE01003900.1.p1  ORF type:complete len:625 (+),score=215.04 GGOE01003900.1:89-1963(+)
MDLHDVSAHELHEELPTTGSFLRRKAVSSPHIDAESARTFKPRHIPKSPEELKALQAFLLENCLFVHLEETGLQSILTAMEKLHFQSGDVIVQQGQKGENFYVVSSGQVGVVIGTERVSKIRQGGTFGELELMYDTPCASTIVAESSQVDIWALDSFTYKLLVMSAFISKRQQYEDLLGRVPIFRGLTAYERNTLADALTPSVFRDGDHIVRYGEEGDWLYVVEDGTVQLIGRTLDNEPVTVMELTDGGWFGDLEFLNNHPNFADVVAKGTVKIVKLNRYHIELCMGTLKEMLRQNISDPLFEYYRERMLARSVKYIGRGGRRRAPVSSETYEPYDDAFVPPDNPKSEADSRALEARLQTNPLFWTFAPAELQATVAAMARKVFGAGDLITHQGEFEGYFFVVEQGTCTMQVDDNEPRPLGPGEAFGELELLYNLPCQATVQARTDVQQWTLDRRTYRHIAMRGQLKKRQQAKALLHQLPVFRQYSPYQCLIVAGYMAVQVVPAGEVVVQHGTKADRAFILFEGSLDVEGGDRTPLGRLTPQDYPILGAVEVARGVGAHQVTARAAVTCRVGVVRADKLGLCLSPCIYDVPPSPPPIQKYYADLARSWAPRRLGYFSHAAASVT